MSRRRLRFESLESRHMMAGDILASNDVPTAGAVSVVVAGGTMVITGDATPGVSVTESIRILQGEGDSPTTFSVLGLMGTRINGGEPDTAASFSGVTGSIRIDLKRGDDRVEITNARILGSLTVNAGAGTNSVMLQDVTADRDLTITSPIASERISVRRVNVTAGKLSINAGRVKPVEPNVPAIELDDLVIKRDVVVVALYPSQDNSDTETMSLKGSRVDGSLLVNAGAGRINVLIQDNEVIAGNVRIKSTKGDDTVGIEKSPIGGRLQVDLGAGANDSLTLKESNVARSVTIRSLATAGATVDIAGSQASPVVLGGPLTVTTGRGSDTIRLAWADVRGTTAIATGSGADDVWVHTVTPRSLAIDTGFDDDVVRLNRLVGSVGIGSRIVVRQGRGFDLLMLNDVNPGQFLSTLFDGGPDGTGPIPGDTLVFSPEQVFAGLGVIGYEIYLSQEISTQ